MLKATYKWLFGNYSDVRKYTEDLVSQLSQLNTCGHLVGATKTLSRGNPTPVYIYRTTSLDLNNSNNCRSSPARAAPADSDNPKSKGQLLVAVHEHSESGEHPSAGLPTAQHGVKLKSNKTLNQEET